MSRKDHATRASKTNAMRELERGGVAYEVLAYDPDAAEAGASAPDRLGVHIAELLGEDPDSAFKTLVTVTPAGSHVVCCVPVASELDLKKAAAAAGEKSLAMTHVRDLEPVTGYVRGGCSPVGMKRAFPTIIDETAQLFGTIGISGGRRGLSLRVDSERLARFLDARFADICR